MKSGIKKEIASNDVHTLACWWVMFKNETWPCDYPLGHNKEPVNEQIDYIESIVGREDLEAYFTNA